MVNSTDNINVSVTFRNTKSTSALKSYAVDKVTHCLSKYVNYDTNVHVILSVQKLNHVAEVIVPLKGNDISAKATTTDLYSAIDKVVDTINRLSRKKKERQRSQKKRKARKAKG